MKSFLTAAIIVGILALGVVAFRGMLQKQRDACADRLADIGSVLETYAGKHRGRLPARAEDLREILGQDAETYTGAIEMEYQAKFSWNRGDALPYLWDRNPHPFPNGYHVLYTDGSVDVLETTPTKDDF